jgi:hypothetical protein
MSRGNGGVNNKGAKTRRGIADFQLPIDGTSSGRSCFGVAKGSVHENVISAPSWGEPSVQAGGQSRSFQLPGVIAGGVEDSKDNDGVAFNAVEELVEEALGGSGKMNSEGAKTRSPGRRENGRQPVSAALRGRLGKGA